MDTSTFTHFYRAGHHEVLRKLAPGGQILIPDTVRQEIEDGRELDYDLPDISTLPWVDIGVLTLQEEATQLLIRVDMPTKAGESWRSNLGECAVLACAQHREMLAILDDGDARTQARNRKLKYLTSMGIIVESYRKFDDIDGETAERIYQDLRATHMRLPPVDSVIGWAYELGLLT